MGDPGRQTLTNSVFVQVRPSPVQTGDVTEVLKFRLMTLRCNLAIRRLGQSQEQGPDVNKEGGLIILGIMVQKECKIAIAAVIGVIAAAGVVDGLHLGSYACGLLQWYVPLVWLIAAGNQVESTLHWLLQQYVPVVAAFSVVWCSAMAAGWWCIVLVISASMLCRTLQTLQLLPSLIFPL